VQNTSTITCAPGLQETLEYQNAIETSALLENGMAAGVFPKDSGWYPATTFKEHLRIQQSSGHSAWIEKAYEAT
jgi:hypothetical protein